MNRSEAARAAGAYTAAALATAVTAFVASIPFTGVAVTAVTADAAILVGFPALLAADRITFHRRGSTT